MKYENPIYDEILGLLKDKNWQLENLVDHFIDKYEYKYYRGEIERHVLALYNAGSLDMSHDEKEISLPPKKEEI